MVERLVRKLFRGRPGVPPLGTVAAGTDGVLGGVAPVEERSDDSKRRRNHDLTRDLAAQPSEAVARNKRTCVLLPAADSSGHPTYTCEGKLPVTLRLNIRGDRHA